jgi:hypothetical protein
VANLLAKPTSAAGIEIEVSNPNRTALEISAASFNVMVGKGSQQRECMLEWVGKHAAAESIVLAPMRSVTGKVIVPDQKPDHGAYISVTDTTTRRGLRIML